MFIHVATLYSAQPEAADAFVRSIIGLGTSEMQTAPAVDTHYLETGRLAAQVT